MWACDRPPDHEERGGDCDDADPALNRPLESRRLEDRSAEAGFDDVGVAWNGVDHPCIHEALGGGGAVGDVDGDGDLDLFRSKLYDFDQLLLNDGAGSFTVDPGFPGSWDPSNGALFVDIDGDRDLDLYVSRIGAAPNLLYVNDGTGRFADETELRGAGLDPRPECSDQFGVTAADVEGDGDLDLFVAGWTEKPLLGTRDRTRLLLNDGEGFFTDGTLTSGLDALWERAPFGGAFADRDRDGDLDLYVASDWGLSGVATNEGGQFTLEPELPFATGNAMGADLADADGDGDPDWFLSAIWEEPVCTTAGWWCEGNRMLFDDGAGGFLDATDYARVREGQWGWGAAMFDQDQDGVQDLILAGGMPYDAFDDQTGRFWRGVGAGRFEERTCEVGYVRKGIGRGVVPFDADGDGDLDVLGIGSAELPVLWRNVGSEDRGSLIVALDQPLSSNRWAVGARVVVRGAGDPKTGWVSAHPSYLVGRPPVVHFGLGDHHDPVEVEVTWPDGASTSWSAVPQGTVTLVR